MSNDKFSQTLPSFNLQGKPAVSSRLGTSLTFIAGVVVLIYALAKLTLVSNVQGQSVSYYEE